MKSYIEKFSKLENSGSKIANAWKAGNKALINSMGEDYYFLDDNQLGTAMVINDDSLNAIKKELVHSFGNVDGRTLTPLAKSIASGTFFTELGKQAPKPTPMPATEKTESPIVEINDAEKEQTAKNAEKLAKAKRTGRGNPVFQKLMPGNLNGKFMGKTGKFTVEYPIGADVAKKLNEKVGEIADFADEQLGNEEYTGREQRIFVSKELQKEDTSVCVVLYHGIEGEQNKEIAAAVKDAIRDAIPYSVPMTLGANTSVLNTELRVAEANYSVAGFDISKYAPQSSHIMKLQRENQMSRDAISNVQLDETLAPRQSSYEEEACLAM